MLLGILSLLGLVPFALVAFLYREAHINLRQALTAGAALALAVGLIGSCVYISL